MCAQTSLILEFPQGSLNQTGRSCPATSLMSSRLTLLRVGLLTVAPAFLEGSPLRQTVHNTYLG